MAATPGDRGIICGALSPAPDSDDGPELLLWAAGYAASTGGRGPARVGLASASSFADLPWDAAVRKLERLGEAARLADQPVDTRVRVARSARRQQPERGARSRRSAAVPRPGPG